MARRPLATLSPLYAGFVFMVLVSQASGRLLAQALAAYDASAAQLAAVQQESSGLAVTAAALGLAFSAAVVFTVRRGLDPELRAYRATGLPVSSALRLIVRFHVPFPLASALAAGGVAALADVALGLDPLYPAALAVCFAGTLLVWLALHVYSSMSRREVEGQRPARVG